LIQEAVGQLAVVCSDLIDADLTGVNALAHNSDVFDIL
jgi:hypothetical protein